MNKKLLVFAIIFLFIGAIIVPSTGKNIELNTINFPLESTYVFHELSTCDHIVYFGGYADDLMECWLYEGTLNELCNSTCICYSSGGSGDFISGSTWTNDGRLLGCEYGNGRMWEIYPETCDMSVIGGGGYSLNGLAYDPTTDILYGCSSNTLFEIDPDTGEQTEIGSFNTNYAMIDMAFDEDGVLYGWDVKSSGESYLYMIDTDTGCATIIGGMGMTLYSAQGGDFCKEDDILYLAAYISSPIYGTYFVECDEDTGECIILGEYDGTSELAIFVIPWNLRPYKPYGPTPANGATGIIPTEMSWNGGDPDGDPVTYDIYFGNSSPPPLVASNISNTSWIPYGNLEYCTTYYWKIVAWDWYGASNEGPIWNFTINCKPDAPIITGRTKGKTWTEYEYKFSIFDPDGDEMLIHVDWGDGIPGKWDGDFPSGSIIKYNYSWRTKGIYTIRAQTIDSNGFLSDWGELIVTMPRDKAISSSLFLRSLDRFPLLIRVLNILIKF